MNTVENTKIWTEVQNKNVYYLFIQISVILKELKTDVLSVDSEGITFHIMKQSFDH